MAGNDNTTRTRYGFIENFAIFISFLFFHLRSDIVSIGLFCFMDSVGFSKEFTGLFILYIFLCSYFTYTALLRQVGDLINLSRAIKEL